MGMLRVCIWSVSGTDTSLLAAGLLRALADRGQAACVSLEIAGLGQEIVLNRPPDLAHLVLLLGLDSSEAQAHAADQAIRCKLAGAGQPFAVLYGSNPERQTQALELIDRQLHGLPGLQNAAAATIAGSKSGRPWTWMCDKCSDPVCEHRLLSDLLVARLA